MKNSLLIFAFLFLGCNKTETEPEPIDPNPAISIDSVPPVSDSSKSDSLQPRREYYDDIW